VSRRLLVLGAGGHARAVAAVAVACGWEVAGFTDRVGSASALPVRGGDDDLPRLTRELGLDGAVVGVGDSGLARRAPLLECIRAAGLAAPALVHPRACADPSARVGDGSVVFPNVVLGADVAVGANAVLYSGAIIEHGGRVDDHAYVAPGAILSGQVRVGAFALVGAGAVVLPGLTIGRGAVVGAGAVVTADVEAGATVVGIPARARALA